MAIQYYECFAITKDNNKCQDIPLLVTDQKLFFMDNKMFFCYVALIMISAVVMSLLAALNTF